MKMDFRSVLLALAFAAIGFLAADRMSAAQARPAPLPAPAAGDPGFSGTSGAMAIGVDWVVIVRDNKVYKLNIGKGGDNNRERPWAMLD